MKISNDTFKGVIYRSLSIQIKHYRIPMQQKKQEKILLRIRKRQASKKHKLISKYLIRY